MLLAHEGIKEVMVHYAEHLIQEGMVQTKKEAFDAIAASLTDDMFLYLLKQKITDKNHKSIQK